MHRKFLFQFIGLFLLLRFVFAISGQRRCVSNVCFNGGSCIVEERPGDEAAVFECICPTGYAGTLCEEVLNCSLACQNGGECKFEGQKPFCECKSGFAGLLCDEKSNCQQTGCGENEICLFDLESSEFKCQENKCKPNPCQNNTTCRAIPNDYICECGQGLTGRNCEGDVDECDENPMTCLNGGECKNLIGSFSCICPNGFSGKICEQRSGFCVQKPCGNHGKCEELANDFRCICEEGYYGRLCDRITPTMPCEKPRLLIETEDGTSKCINSVEECLVDGRSCQNGGTCSKSNDGSFFCECDSHSFSGKWCENKLPMADESSSNKSSSFCTPDSCQNNGLCSSENGFVECTCPETFTGRYCELKCACPKDTICRENILNKGYAECLRVESSLSPLDTNTDQSNNTPSPSFSFIDLPPISNFDVANISSCDDCFNNPKCLYVDKRLMCLCPPNFDGPLCSERKNACSGFKCNGNQICRQRRTSFGTIPYCSCPEGTFGSNCQRKLPPATFMPNSVAVIQAPSHLGIKENEFSLEFTFRTTVPNAHIVSGETILNDIQFSFELIDGYLNLQLGEHRIDNLLELRLNDAEWYSVILSQSSDMELQFELHDADTGYVLAHKPLGHQQFNIFTVRFGRLKQNSYFTGCLREIRINRIPIDVFSKDRSVEVIQNCNWQPTCKSDSCGHGSCVELWNSFQCVCRRPYLPPNCLNELQEATFGKDNQSSSLVYSIKPDISNSLASTTEFSFLVRTNKQNGQIFYIGGQNLDDDTNTFISCDVQNGTLSLKSRLGGKTVQQIRGRRKIDDNLPHLVEIRRKDNNFTMNLDNVKEGNLVITRPFAHPLIVDRIVLGDAQSNQTENSTLFKGTLQDVRVNDLNLPLGESSPSFLKPNQTIGNQLIRQNLLMGTVSDDLCAEKPCLRGTCENTFNDYVCTCQKGYMGKNCNLIDYCSSSPCASGIAQCVNTHGGYICKAPATFAKTSQSKFVLKQSADQVLEPRFSFAIRTRSSTARVFKINTLNESLWMELKGESVIFHYTNQSNTIDDPLSVELNNGQWHSIELIESGDGHLSVSFDNSSVPLLSPFSLTRFLGGNDSWLTFGRSQNETGFKGCVHNVRFGDLPDLSFFSLTESGTLSLNGTRHFEVKSLQNIRSDGCHSKDLCNPVNPCRNSGLCKDLFNLRKCECAPGWEGEYCEINIDECVNNKDCGSNGQCVDGINSFSCACRDGFGGPFCSIELDQCVSKPCKNNGKCSTVDGRAVCECSDNFIGQFCTQKRSVKCSDNPCAINNTLGCTDTENGVHCECSFGFHGILCEESIAVELCSGMPCRNGGKCVPSTNGSFECDCPSNFEGDMCQTPKNNCKKGSLCSHGKCRSIFGGYICACDEGYEGLRCELDRNECVDEFPCTNNGTCINKSPGYECSCPQYYLGENCQIAGVCTRSPCKNSAECIQRSATEYRCVCAEGYTGKNCESEIDYCLEKEPCLNGATCQRLLASYKCNCIVGFTGVNCETDIDDCVDNDMCKHGGQCLDRVNGFECNCVETGWSGPRCDIGMYQVNKCCDIDVNECLQPDKCVNGTCQNLPGSYSCQCFIGYIGNTCSIVDPCVLDERNKSLHNCVHGTCVNSRVVKQNSGRYVAEYDCSCYENFSGQFCSHVEQLRKPISIGYILGPGIALLIVSILLVCMLFFFVARNRRANQGTYSPSTHEMNGAARVQMNNLAPMKKQERLI